ncbi:MAG: ABC transporter permease [Bacteroidales bacterium]|nr:MAG: ABC transporter permease [Bacteroidales bacterium]
MRKILILASREYRTSVRTKSFVIGILLAPVLMGGSMVAFMLLKDKVDIRDKTIAVIDHSELMADTLVKTAEYRNENEIFDEETGEKIRPAYLIEVVQADSSDLFNVRLELSDRVRSRELHAFLEIGSEIIHPSENYEKSRIKYYSEHAFMDDVINWFSWPINNRIRQIRIAELNLNEEAVGDLFYWNNIESMGLINVDKKTGDLQDAERTNELETFLIPYIMVLLMFMMVMMSAIPLLTAVMEEKIERIAEVLLGSVTPFQFMMGKIIGSISVSLTISAVYIIGGIVTASQMDVGDMIPFHVLPWFFTFLVLFVIMVGSTMAALGSACNDNKDAQSLQFPAMIPVLLPLFIMIPIIQNPISGFATTLSLIPPFTPTLMIIRLATPVTIPLWQPIAGLAGVILYTIFSVWAGGRIFRTCILMQGTKPKLANMIRYVFRG